MTYPPSNPGYPPTPQSGSQFDATQQFAKAVPAQTPAAPAAPVAVNVVPGENKLPEILLAVVAGVGLLIYFVSFAFEIQAVIGSLIIAVPLVAGLVAGVSVLPKQKNRVAPAAVLATLGLLLAISVSVAAGGGADWTIWVLLVLTLIQAGAAIAALLFHAGIITPPAPKPQFDQQPQYGQYGGPSQYYGQQHQPQHGGQPYQQAQPQQPGYPSQYGGYSSGPNTGGYPVQSPQGPQGQQGQQPSGPPTPPTGYPTYGQPQQSGSSAPSGGPAQQPPSQQSGPAPS
ncbi:MULTISPECIES: DUF5336 domain-containing protein [Mycolicibacterium]|uniref:Antigen 34 kDa n=3 Tax=Mycolicibacterium fortuitum TaxID=1766 RepID=A0A0N9YKQ6_MYCFO|nr:MULTISPECIES: DUF5336 domain-containing protein [Mycolicibacterium]AIY48165.1 Twin-arginine translocation protein TatA [Mycobacterium sp. VKM Ac-1817D]CRL82000.1 antigen 34 kDa [Mycolicibacter nonchromogenicus]ALI28744.1 antigen 34 kDa [Mycolicibacterium fortuitum]EJZ09130.1 antigen 34 kDa [Mycolicibacterium fortuitum subsp. fortuitum DSM 46621 = ATCC 6841 = JCM 6387]MBP3083596.1 DUF5336 domain-containing protein [Mycolicibacterium fortuitum]